MTALIAKIHGTLADGTQRYARQEVADRAGFHEYCQKVKSDFSFMTATLVEDGFNSEGQRQITEIVTHTYRKP